MKRTNADICSIELNEIKKANMEELFSLFRYCLKNMICYCCNKKNNISKECYNIFKEFYNIYLYEKKVLNFLINHLSYIEEEKLDIIIKKMEILNEKTITYFYNYLNFLEKNKNANLQFTKNKKEFDILQNDESLKKEISNSIFTKEFVQTYLGFEQDFWKFIDSRTTFSDEITTHVIDYKYIQNYQIQLKLTLPVIKDLKTAIECVRGYSKVHILYFSNNKTSAKNVEDTIRNYYGNIEKYLKINKEV